MAPFAKSYTFGFAESPIPSAALNSIGDDIAAFLNIEKLDYENIKDGGIRDVNFSANTGHRLSIEKLEAGTAGQILTSSNAGTPLAQWVTPTGDVIPNHAGLFTIQPLSVETGMIALGAVDTDQIATGAVEAAELASNAVETAKIKDGNVTGAKIEAGKGLLGNVETYTADETWTKPSGLKFILVEVVGGGGGGGKANTTSAGQRSGGGGGGGGGRSFKKIAAADLASTVAVTVGSGGAGGTGAGNGSTGETSSFGAHCQATGGSGGTSGTAGTGAALMSGGDGGAGSGGDLNFKGGGGGNNNRNAQDVQMFLTGVGGGVPGFAGMSDAPEFNVTGKTGKPYGGGGGGANNGTSQTAADGGAGADGVVVVYEFF